MTIATVKAKYKPWYYILVIFLINQSKEIGEKHFSVSVSKGGQNTPLMHVPLMSGIDGCMSQCLRQERQNKTNGRQINVVAF